MHDSMTRNIFTHLLFFTILTLLGSTAHAIGADADALLFKTVNVRSAPDGAAGKLIGRLLIGEVVRIQKITGDSAFVQGAKYTGWVPVENIIRINTFLPMREWRGAKPIAVGDGDYSATYNLNSDGTFSVTESEPGANKIYRTITRTGRLHYSGNFIWAKRPDGGFYSRQIFVRNENGKRCWQPYMDGRCGTSP